MSPRHSTTLAIEHVLLALLDSRPMHGYELYQELCALPGISLVWNLKQAMLYAILDKLEGNGLLSSQLARGESYPPRRNFQLTAEGKLALETWIQTPVRRARYLRQEFLAKLIIARRYRQDTARELIRLQEQACHAWLAELETALAALAPDQVDEWIVVSYRIQRLLSALTWLKACAVEIDRPVHQG